MKKKIRALILTVALTIAIVGMGTVSYACSQGVYVLYYRYLARQDPPTPCSIHTNCTVTVYHYENDYRCTACGDMYHITSKEPHHSNND